MFDWKHSETVDVDADASQVWALWSDPETWPVWSTELERVVLDGAFVEGTKGTMKPAARPELAFELIQVKPNQGFVGRVRLPLTTLDFAHDYIPANDPGEAARITHAAEFRGVLAPLFGVLIGRDIKRHMRPAMQELAKRARTLSPTGP